MDIYDAEPYACLVDPIIDAEWPIARAYDFFTVLVMGVNFSSQNNSPEIRGVDPEYDAKFGETTSGGFALYDGDEFDVGSLTVQLTVSGNDITKDCDCLEFEAEYSKGTEKSL